MSKILAPKFWSLGTSLGSMGSGSQKGPLEIFSNVVFLHPWDPNKAPDNAFEPSLAEKLKRIPTRCVRHITPLLIALLTNFLFYYLGKFYPL